MNRLILIAAALILAVAIVGWTTETRVMTLGDANNILKDEANIFLYPSTITFYKNIVLGEVDNTGLYRVGSNFDLGQSWGTIGVYLDKKGLALSTYDYRPNIGTSGIDNRLNLFYGKSFRGMDFGTALSLYRDSYQVENDTTNQEQQSNTSLSLVVGFTLNKCLDLTVGATFDSWTWKGDTSEVISEPEGNNVAFKLLGRYYAVFTDKVNFIPHAGFSFETGGFNIGNYPSASVADSQKVKWKDLMFDLGCGVNIHPTDRILMLLDLGVILSKSTSNLEFTGGDFDTLNLPEVTSSVLDFPYFRLGLEGQVTKWWDIRLGAIKRWENTSDEQVWIYTYYNSVEVKNPIFKYGEGLTVTYIGSGFHFNHLDLDIWMDPNFVLKGPNFISGYSGQLATMASLKYRW